MVKENTLRDYEHSVRECARLEMALGLACRRRDAARRAMLEADDLRNEPPTASSVCDAFLIPGETLDAFTLSERTGITIDAARQKLSRAARIGIVVRVQHGSYLLVPTMKIEEPVRMEGSEEVKAVGVAG